MKLDVNKLMDLNYLNSIIESYNNEISQLKKLCVEYYSFDQIKGMSKDEIVKLFGKYNVACTNIFQYLESDFIDESWEFADLFLEDMKYSNELKDSFATNALKEVDALNSIIKVENEDVEKQILDVEEKVKTIKKIIKLFDNELVVSSEDIKFIYDFIMSLDASSLDKFIYSNSLSMMLIEKNKEIFSRKKDNVDTDEFEKKLDEVYDSTVESPSEEETLIEGTYSETIKGYYGFYKKLIDEVGLGSSLDEVMEVSLAIGDGIDSTLHSINKEDFCIELGYALGNLNKSQDVAKVDQELMSDALMDLAVLDRIYEENEKNQGKVNELRNKIVNDLDLFSLIPSELLENEFVKKLVNVLKLLKLELNHNLMDTEGLNVITKKYKDVSSRVSKIQAIIKMLDILNRINNGILEFSKNEYLLSAKEQETASIYALQCKVVALVDHIKANGYTVEYENQTKELSAEFKKVTKVIKEVKEVPTNDDKITLKGFVLFDVDDDLIPYVLTDMDPKDKNNLLDASIPPKKMVSGFEDYSKLIRDLHVFAKPELIVDNNKIYYMSRIMDNVYYDEARNHSTGIVRVRPLRNSLVRFMCKEIVLTPNTEIYNQVTSTIMEMLPNVSINLNEEFAVFINFASSLKIADTDSYTESIHRFDRKSPLYRLFFGSANKTSFTTAEQKLFKEMLSVSLNAYTELEKKNDSLNFDFVDKIGGKKSRG